MRCYCGSMLRTRCRRWPTAVRTQLTSSARRGSYDGSWNPDPQPQCSPSLLPGIIHQSCRHIVLDPSPCIAPSDPNQKLQAVGRHGHAGGGHQGLQGEHHGPRPVGVHSPSVRNNDLRLLLRVMGKLVLWLKTGKRERKMWRDQRNQESDGDGWK